MRRHITTAGIWLAALALLALSTATPASYFPASVNRKVAFIQNQDVTVGNTTTEGSLLGTGVGSLTIPANGFAAAGYCLHWRATGYIYNGNTAPTIRIRVKLGGSTVLDSTATTMTAMTTGSAVQFEIEGAIHCTSTGVSGACWCEGFSLWCFRTLDYGPNSCRLASSATVTVNTTTTNTFDLTAQWGTAAANDTVTITAFTMEMIPSA